MSKHTKGPWTVHQSHVYAPDGAIIAQVHNPGSKASDYPLDANARLIAAAPRMFEILCAIGLEIDEVTVGNEAVDIHEFLDAVAGFDASTTETTP